MKDKTVVVEVGGILYSFHKPTLSVVDYAGLANNGLAYPKNYYLSAYEAVKKLHKEDKFDLSRVPAGLVLIIGMALIEHSGLLKKEQQMQDDYEQTDANYRTYYHIIRTLAAAHLGCPIKESAEWEYEQVIEYAHRLSFLLSKDFSPDGVLHPGATNKMSFKEGQVLINKGDKIPEEFVKFHNKKAEELQAQAKFDLNR